MLPLRFRKAGRVWCGGAREPHWATCHNGVTPSKTKEVLKYSCFLRSLRYHVSVRKLFIKNKNRFRREIISENMIVENSSSKGVFSAIYFINNLYYINKLIIISIFSATSFHQFIKINWFWNRKTPQVGNYLKIYVPRGYFLLFRSGTYWVFKSILIRLFGSFQSRKFEVFSRFGTRTSRINSQIVHFWIQIQNLGMIRQVMLFFSLMTEGLTDGQNYTHFALSSEISLNFQDFLEHNPMSHFISPFI